MALDLTGKKFGKLTAIEITGTTSFKVKKWLCKCECGGTIEVGSNLLINGHIFSCSCVSGFLEDLTGKQYGDLIVLEYVGDKYWKCKCVCGNIKNIYRGHLNSGKIISCGCSKHTDLIGMKFGKLTPISVVNTVKKKKRTKRIWLCKCDCGNEIELATTYLTSGDTQSCGCLRQEGGVNRKYHPRISSAKRVYSRGYNDGDITFEQFLELSQQDCFYCGAKPANISNRAKTEKRTQNTNNYSKFTIENGDFIYNGLDRVDNTKGHLLNNVVPCCYTCNKMKLNLSEEKFKNQIIKIYNKYCK